MKKGSMKFSQEFKSIFIIILILSFVFGFNDNKPEFILNNWIMNFIYIFALVSLIVLFNVLGYKLAAKYFGTKVNIKLWSQDAFKEKFEFRKMHKYVFSPVLAILFTLFSNGKIFLSLVSTFDIKDYSLFGKKYPKLTYFNNGLIVVCGLFFNFILMILFKIF
ncbi:MAG: hypothetical protein AABX61_00005, partial [Nanoarchaeota archaeon]